MSDRDGRTHFVGDDCPGGHRLDPSTPAQVAEEEEREAQATIAELHESWCPAPLCNGYPEAHVQISRVSAAIDRAVKAARWAQHGEDCSLCLTEREGERTCHKRDRLRRDYMESK